MGMDVVHLLELIASILGTIGGISGLISFFRLVPKVIDRAQLVAENTTLRGQIDDLQTNLETLTTLATSSNAAIEQFKNELSQAITYITQLVRWVKNGVKSAPMPQPPPELRHLIAVPAPSGQSPPRKRRVS